MEITSIRPEPSGGGGTVARFDAQLDGLRLFNIALKRTRSGWRVFAPSAFGNSVVTFSPETAVVLTEAARDAFGAICQHDRNSR